LINICAFFLTKCPKAENNKILHQSRMKRTQLLKAKRRQACRRPPKVETSKRALKPKELIKVTTISICRLA